MFLGTFDKKQTQGTFFSDITIVYHFPKQKQPKNIMFGKFRLSDKERRFTNAREQRKQPC